MKIVLLGSNGMLGGDMNLSLRIQGYEVLSYDRVGINVTESHSLDTLKSVLSRGDVLINATAYTAVDIAEGVGKRDAFQVNGYAPYLIGRFTHKLGVSCIHISTDYVFSSDAPTVFMPESETLPVNTYGLSKEFGEKLLRNENPDAIIIRTSALYSGQLYQNPEDRGANHFVNKILKKLRETSDLVRVVDDQFFAPTNGYDLVGAVERLLGDISSHQGQIFHFTNSIDAPYGISWYELAREIARIDGKQERVISMSAMELNLPAQRSKYSYIKNTSDILLPDWRDSLERYLRGHIS